MRIKAFGVIIDQTANPHILKDSSLVIDAQNFFYDCYEDSKLRVELGAECDRYADYLRKHLSMFKEANIKCYFIFKGGTKYLVNKIIKDQKHQGPRKKYKPNPIFVTDINLQILREMKFDYVFSEFEAKTDCIAFAKKLSCPLLSMDNDIAISGVKYIIRKSLNFEEVDNTLHCKMFMLDDYLLKFKLNTEKLALFILLSDETYFGESIFADFFTRFRIPQYPGHKRNMSLLHWLSKTSEKMILQNIIKISEKPKETIHEKLDEARKLVARNVTGNLAIDYFSKKQVTKNWFEAGVALNIIAKPYIDIYRTNILLVSGPPVNEEVGHPIQLSLNIIKYAYDLLTDFLNGFKFMSNHWDSNNQPLLIKDSIKKPTYQAVQCVFEKGWDDIHSLGLFQHFITEEINITIDRLEMVPSNAKLLLIALVYFQHKKTGNINKIAYGIILSYVMLGVIPETINNVVDYKFVKASDCKLATELLYEYFKVEDDEIKPPDVKLLYPLLEFQHCLREINHLNKLCGSPFEPTIYAKTFNGIFVYKMVSSMQNEEELLFISQLLMSAPTILNFVIHIIDLYNHLKV